jgi:hypothetical protein
MKRQNVLECLSLVSLPNREPTLDGSTYGLQLIGQSLGQIYNSRSGCVLPYTHVAIKQKLPNLKLKTWLKQLLGFLPLDIVLPGSPNIG